MSRGKSILLFTKKVYLYFRHRGGLLPDSGEQWRASTHGASSGSNADWSGFELSPVQQRNKEQFRPGNSGNKDNTLAKSYLPV